MRKVGPGLEGQKVSAQLKTYIYAVRSFSIAVSKALHTREGLSQTASAPWSHQSWLHPAAQPQATVAFLWSLKAKSPCAEMDRVKVPQLRHPIPPALARLSWALKISAAVFPRWGHCKDFRLPEKSCMTQGMFWLVMLVLGKDWQPEQSRPSVNISHCQLLLVREQSGYGNFGSFIVFACFYNFLVCVHVHTCECAHHICAGGSQNQF